MIVGAQLYTVRDYCQTEKDIERSLKKVAAMGYTAVQVSGLGKIAPERLREICDECGLKIVITHTDPARIMNDTDAVIREHDALGCDLIGLGGMPQRYLTADWLPMFVEDFLPASKKIAAAGKLFMYHNHAFEFRRVGGNHVLEYLAEAFSPSEMGFTLDTYWVQAAGADCRKWLERLNGRVPAIHLKDMAVRGNDHIMAPVGEGNMDFGDICRAAEKAGTQYLLVEQDTCDGSPFDCLRRSLENIRALGY